MTERLRRDSYSNAGYISGKMANDFGLSPRKTMLILVIVVGCFAILWPKVFYPMLVGSATRHIKPSPIDRTKGCCDVISELDVQTLKVMSEICNTIVKKDGETTLSGRELVAKCRSDVLDTCGIDISAVLQEQVRLGQTTKQILDEVRSLNGSLCLKYNFGVSPWTLGVPHRVTVKVSPSYSIRQERPPHLRSEMVHPAFRERGRAIPQTQPSPKPSPPSRLIPKVVPGRPGPLPGMRPTLGGAGHVVPSPKQGTGSMGLIMPIYTIGIVIFFTYTVMKVVFKKQPESLYPSVESDPNFRAHVFEPERLYTAPKISKDGTSSKIVVNAMSALLDEVDQELSSRRKTSEGTDQDVVANGGVLSQDEDQASVKVVGMEMRASCEGGKRWSRPDSPVLPAAQPPISDSAEPPQEIFLEGALPPQSHLLVTDSATEAQNINSEEDPAVVLAGKMTLSVISLDSSENGTDESSNSGRKYEERSSSNVSEEFEKIEADPLLEEEIDDIIDKAKQIGLDQSLLDEIRKELHEEREDVVDSTENFGEKVQEIIEPTGDEANVENEASPQIDDFLVEKRLQLEKENLLDIMNQSLEEKVLQGVATGSFQKEDTETEEQLPSEEVSHPEEKVDNKFEEDAVTEEQLSPEEVSKPEGNILEDIIHAEVTEANKDNGLESVLKEEFAELEQKQVEKDEGSAPMTKDFEQEIGEVEKKEAIILEESEMNEPVNDVRVESALNTESGTIEKLELSEPEATEEVDETVKEPGIIDELQQPLLEDSSIRVNGASKNSLAEEETTVTKEKHDTEVKPEMIEKVEESLLPVSSSKENGTVDELLTESETKVAMKNPETVVESEKLADTLLEQYSNKDGSVDKLTENVTEAVEEPENVGKPSLELASTELNCTVGLPSESRAQVSEEKVNAGDDEEEVDDEEEEVEYEYEESDEEVDEEIRNAERSGDTTEVIANGEKMNGGIHNGAKNGLRDDEDEVSEEDNSEGQEAEEDEVEEIIEYVTDEEEEEDIEVVEPTQSNNINNVNEENRMN